MLIVSMLIVREIVLTIVQCLVCLAIVAYIISRIKNYIKK